MAKPIEVEVRVGVTKNIGNFESLRLDYSTRVQLKEDESVTVLIDSTRNFLFSKMKTDFEASNAGKAWIE